MSSRITAIEAHCDGEAKACPSGELVSFPQSGEVLRGVMENAPIGMSLVDADGRVVYANQAFADMFGRSRSDCIGLGRA